MITKLEDSYCKTCGHSARLHGQDLTCYGVVKSALDCGPCTCEVLDAIVVDLHYVSVGVLDERVLV